MNENTDAADALAVIDGGKGRQRTGEQLDLLDLVARPDPGQDARGRPLRYFSQKTRPLAPGEAVIVEVYDCANITVCPWVHQTEVYCSACGADIGHGLLRPYSCDRKPCEACGAVLGALWRWYTGGYNGNAEYSTQCVWLRGDRCYSGQWTPGTPLCPVRTETGTCPLLAPTRKDKNK